MPSTPPSFAVVVVSRSCGLFSVMSASHSAVVGLWWCGLGVLLFGIKGFSSVTSGLQEFDVIIERNVDLCLVDLVGLGVVGGNEVVEDSVVLGINGVGVVVSVLSVVDLDGNGVVVVAVIVVVVVLVVVVVVGVVVVVVVVAVVVVG